MQQVFFTPGPAQLYPTFAQHVNTFVNKQLGSISHRSQAYRDLHGFTVSQLRTLLNVPETHSILFLGSASEAWERILLNIVARESFHLTNGSFSKKFYQYAQAAGRIATKLDKPLGQGFTFDEIVVPESAELIGLAHNETSSGVQTPVETIHRLKQQHPDKFIAVDMVSSAPYPALDYSLIDTAFFSVQKAFGLPAGLGVWIVSERCLQRAQELKQTQSIGAHHDLPTLWKNAQTNETPATPNVMLIYLLGKIAEDMNTVGVSNIRAQTEQKAKLIYDFADQSDLFEPFVKVAEHRSQTVAVLNTKQPASEIIAQLKQHQIVVGSGYGELKNNQIRVANFPATSLEEVQKLLEILRSF